MANKREAILNGKGREVELILLHSSRENSQQGEGELPAIFG